MDMSLPALFGVYRHLPHYPLYRYARDLDRSGSLALTGLILSQFCAVRWRERGTLRLTIGLAADIVHAALPRWG